MSFTENFTLHGDSFTIDTIIKEIFNFSTFGSDFIIIIKHFIITFFKYPIWIFLLIFFIFPESRIKRNKIYKNTIYIFLFIFFVNFFIFHIQNSEILEWHLSTALDRLNFILSGYFVYFVYSNINNYLDEFIKNE